MHRAPALGEALASLLCTMVEWEPFALDGTRTGLRFDNHLKANPPTERSHDRE